MAKPATHSHLNVLDGSGSTQGPLLYLFPIRPIIATAMYTQSQAPCPGWRSVLEEIDTTLDHEQIFGVFQGKFADL